MSRIFNLPLFDSGKVADDKRAEASGEVPADALQDPADSIIDSEIFIRKSFDSDVASGCKLLFQAYYKPLCNYAVRIVYSREVAEDIVADVFCSFWDHKAYLTIRHSYRSYLISATRNRCFNYLKLSRTKDLPIENAGYHETSAANLPEHIMLYHDLSQRIESLIHHLPPQCRRIFVMNRFEGKMAKEIAADLGLSTRTIEVQIAKALAVLRQGLKNYGLESMLGLLLAIGS